ncbi:MAG TPA: CDGSH iron-sulfur domain-containing protein [Gaiellaceae bacterium]|nr:CDGSH iron-sulfur domain-containing protein [Gaiellaceae bacterium]
MDDATITPSDNGPYLIQGNVTLLDAEGNPYKVNGTIALCRCGYSYTKPFCDGSHEKTNFAAVSRASLSSHRVRPQVVASR